MMAWTLRLLTLAALLAIVPACGPSTPFSKARGLSGIVYAVAFAADGDVYAAGSFVSYDDTAAGRILRFNPDGTVDAGFAVGTGFDAEVLSLAVATDGSGDIYAAGNFMSYNGTPRVRLARLHADGTLDETFNEGSGFDGTLMSVTVAADGDILVGGGFVSYNGNGDVSRLVKLNPDGSLDESFSVGTAFGFSANVQAVAEAVDGSGDIYVGGYFTTSDGAVTNHLLRLNADGTVDADFVTGGEFNSGFDNDVTRIVPLADGDVYVAGNFFSYNGVPGSGVRRLNADGSIDEEFVIGSGLGNGATSMILAPDGSGDLYVGGYFETYDVTPARGLVRLTSFGGVNPVFALGGGFDEEVFALAAAVDGSNDICVGGDFASLSGAARGRLARLNEDGTQDLAFATPLGTGFDNLVYALAAAGEGKVYVGGGFETYNGAVAPQLVRLLKDGTVDPAFSIGAGFDILRSVQALLVDAAGGVYAGGNFEYVNGVPSRNLARFNPDGTVDAGFNVGAGFNGFVQALAFAKDGSGDLYAGGQFSTYNNQQAVNLVRLNADGSLDGAFALGAGFNGDVEAIVTLPDGRVYVGGRFTAYDGAAASRIARLNADGSMDATFVTGTGFENLVYTLAAAVDGSGDVYVGGFFTSYDGQAAFGPVRLNDDGSLDAGFAVTAWSAFPAKVILPLTDGSGDVVVGGSFQGKIQRLKSIGTPRKHFEAGTGFDHDVFAIVEAGDATKDLYVGGFFSAYKTDRVDRIARLTPAGTSK